MQRELLTAVLCLMSFAGGCGGGGGTAGPTRLDANNLPPTITGSPPRYATRGESYRFRPQATDPEGWTLSYSIVNKPAWASFDAWTGRLAGRPDAADVGVYENIVISVSDGMAVASLPAFDITVDAQGDGSVTLSWLPPTENSDGSPLRNLAGYRIYYGRSPNSLDRTIALNNPGLTRYVVEGLPPAKWYFAMTSRNRRGKESQRSGIVSQVVG